MKRPVVEGSAAFLCRGGCCGHKEGHSGERGELEGRSAAARPHEASDAITRILLLILEMKGSLSMVLRRREKRSGIGFLSLQDHLGFSKENRLDERTQCI